MTVINNIAFIGLGQMGLPMAKHLVQAGLRVTGIDPSEAARKAFALAGGQVAEQADFTGMDAVVTMLPNGKIVAEALLGPAKSTLKPGTLVLEMSSSSPTDTRRLAEALGSGIRLVDAPVSGGVKRAVEGSLTIMVGGASEDIDLAQPILKCLAARVISCGPVGAGHAVKAINNFVSATGTLAAIEALHLGKAFGLDGDALVDVLNASSGRSNATEVKMKQFVLSGSYASGFALGLMAKDVRTAADLAQDLGLTLPTLEQMATLWAEASESLGGGADHTRIDTFVAGLQRNKT